MNVFPDTRGLAFTFNNFFFRFDWDIERRWTLISEHGKEAKIENPEDLQEVRSACINLLKDIRIG